jgi:rhamnose utilization protein RhaD (predicted bifunctional aldolase and dehydrogenase)
VVTITSNKDGERYIRQIYPEFLVIPYVMPGFILAKTIYDMTKNLNWQKCNGIILLNHGIFTFDDDPKKSYLKMIESVSLAEDFLAKNAPLNLKNLEIQSDYDLTIIRETISKYKGYDVALEINQSPLALVYASQDNLQEFACRGVLTPEHIIRTKRVPVVVEDGDLDGAIEKYIEAYEEYFQRWAQDEVMLHPAPNYMVVKNFGVVSFGRTQKEAQIIYDIVEHTMLAVLRADMLGGYQSISEADSFAMEYWELEQAKLKK